MRTITRNCRVYQGCTKLVPITPTETNDPDKVEWREEFHLTHMMIEDILLDMTDLLLDYMQCMTNKDRRKAEKLIKEAEDWKTSECQVDNPTVWDNPR